MTVATDDRVLLSAPLGLSNEAKVGRSQSLNYENTSSKFRLGEGCKDYNRQYFEIYGARLAAMRPMIISAAKKELGDDVQIKTLAELREDTDEVSQSQQDQHILIIGTVFKQQERKPSILKELSEDGDLDIEPAHTKYTADTDSLILEDETMRVKLECDDENLKPGVIVNGVVAGFWGKEAQGGKFNVKKAVYADVPCQPSSTPEEETSISFISGLDLGGEEGGAWLGAAQLAVDWLIGSVGAPTEHESVAKIERLVIAGDSLSSSTRDRGEQSRAKYLTVGNSAGSIAAVRQLDDILLQLASSVATDIMPGPSDPATCVLPQQPLHKLMFPQAGRLPTLQSVTNPYSLSVAGRKILITSGQTISDVLRNSELESSLDAMERCLIWGHIAPTTPDTLGLFPYSNDDPHVLSSLPDVFVAGNQSEYCSREIEISGHKIILISLPRFSESQNIVRLNLKTLVCDTVNFSLELE